MEADPDMEMMMNIQAEFDEMDRRLDEIDQEERNRSHSDSNSSHEDNDSMHIDNFEDSGLDDDYGSDLDENGGLTSEQKKELIEQLPVI